jgi:butyryl-CoA dehydrogenase
MFELTREQEMLRAMVREFADTELAPSALELDRAGEFPYDVVKKLAEQRLIGVGSSKELGGAAAGHLASIIVIEELARVYPSIAMFLDVDQSSIYIVEHSGTEEQKKKYLPPTIRGEKIMCLAATEPSGGSALADLGTEAVADQSGYNINGRKVFITNGGVADYCVLLAKTGKRTNTLLVEKGTPGFIVSRRQDQMGLKSLNLSELAFNDCKVPGENLIGEEGRGLATALATFAVARSSTAAIGLGIARGAFEIAVKFAKERVLYGKPIGNLQSIQLMLADMDTEIEAAKWLTYYPCAALDHGASSREINKYSARAKAISAEVASGVTQKAIQILGAYGVSPEYHLARLLNDAMELFPALGTTQVMKVIQAAEILR